MLSSFKSKMEAGNRESACRLIKVILTQAVSSQATKIVFGEPSENGCKRILIDPHAERVHSPPWEKEDRERFIGQSDQSFVEARGSRQGQGLASAVLALLENRPAHQGEQFGSVPLWIKTGDTYEEVPSFPQFLFLPILSVLASWNGLTVPWGSQKPTSDGGKSAGLALGNSNREALSRFVLLLEHGTVVRASLGLESNYCLSITIEDVRK
jgi:hypothetical protein